MKFFTCGVWNARATFALKVFWPTDYVCIPINCDDIHGLLESFARLDYASHGSCSWALGQSNILSRCCAVVNHLLDHDLVPKQHFTNDEIQGGPFGRGQAFVDIEIRVAL